MSKMRIVQEFMILNCIKDIDALHNYVDFCLNNSQTEKRRGQTATHHILPMARTLPFKAFADLRMHPWNSAELLYSDHYRAHYLLTLAVNHLAVMHSFVAMHSKDRTINRIVESDLIDADTYNDIFKNRNAMISSRRLEIIDVDGQFMTRASYSNKNTIKSPDRLSQMSSRMSGKNNIVHKAGVVDKIRTTKSSTVIDGKNLDTISAERAAATMKKPIITETGLTTIYQQAASKQSQTLQKTFIGNNGEVTSLAKEYGKDRSKRMRQNSQWYYLKNTFDPFFCRKLQAPDVRLISPGLEKCTRDNYLGKSKFGRTILTKRGKADLIGLFVEKCE
jgi:hypothetical protein